jgi:hypothetical protein
MKIIETTIKSRKSSPNTKEEARTSQNNNNKKKTHGWVCSPQTQASELSQNPSQTPISTYGKIASVTVLSRGIVFVQFTSKPWRPPRPRPSPTPTLHLFFFMFLMVSKRES